MVRWECGGQDERCIREGAMTEGQKGVGTSAGVEEREPHERQREVTEALVVSTGVFTWMALVQNMLDKMVCTSAIQVKTTVETTSAFVTSRWRSCGSRSALHALVQTPFIPSVIEYGFPGR